MRIVLMAVAILLVQQVFRSEIALVPVYVTVTDRNGRFVPNLEREDFEVTDDGRPRSISTFAQGEQPITLALMLDESPSVSVATTLIAAAVDEFTRHLFPADRVAVGSFAHEVRVDRQFTTRPRESFVALASRGPAMGRGTALWDAIEMGRLLILNEPGRRVVLALTDGVDNCSRIEPSAIRSSLARDGIMLYAIGARGTAGLPAEELRAIAGDSGGYYFELRKDADLSSTFARVAEELHGQYLIGFTPTLVDGAEHQIRVRTKRSGLTVRARRSYIAVKSANPR
jgi:Ca-activated chloride channel family protein